MAKESQQWSFVQGSCDSLMMEFCDREQPEASTIFLDSCKSSFLIYGLLNDTELPMGARAQIGNIVEYMC